MHSWIDASQNESRRVENECRSEALFGYSCEAHSYVSLFSLLILCKHTDNQLIMKVCTDERCIIWIESLCQWFNSALSVLQGGGCCRPLVQPFFYHSYHTIDGWRRWYEEGCKGGSTKVTDSVSLSVNRAHTHTCTPHFLKYYPLPFFFDSTQNLPVWAPVVMHSVAGKYLVLQLSCSKGQHSLLHTVHSLYKALKPSHWLTVVRIALLGVYRSRHDQSERSVKPPGAHIRDSLQFTWEEHKTIKHVTLNKLWAARSTPMFLRSRYWRTVSPKLLWRSAPCTFLFVCVSFFCRMLWKSPSE